MPKYTINVNNKPREVDVDEDTPLLWVLRDELNLLGCKYGCGIGQCGACTVLADGRAMKSCGLPIAQVEELKITTIEGLSTDGSHPVQQAWIEHDVPQCGYCQAGQIMAATSLLNRNTSPNDTEIQEAMNGNICRCGTYLRIREAVKTASKNS